MAALLREKTATSAGQKLKYWWDGETNEDGTTATVNCAEGPFAVHLTQPCKFLPRAILQKHSQRGMLRLRLSCFYLGL